MSYGLYMHWPFCRRKCLYCSFVSSAGAEEVMGPYAESIRRELDSRRNGIFSEEPATVYIGGGTPSLAPSSALASLLEPLSLTPEKECTVEANPDSLSERWMDTLLAAGVNRLSIGVQSFDDRLLEGLGRLHRAEHAEWSVRTARAAGFANVSIDLMFGIPGQSFANWETTLERAAALSVDHISAYSLGLEEDTPFFDLSAKGGLDIPDAGETAEMYHMMTEFLRSRGFQRYEISNFALPGRECRHNMGYWNFTPYLGVGVSAHSFDGSRRWWNTPDLMAYIARIRNGENPMVEEELPGRKTRALEELMLALRLRRGLDIRGYCLRYPELAGILPRRVFILEGEGLLSMLPDGNAILTEAGVMIADEVMVEMAMDMDAIDD